LKASIVLAVILFQAPNQDECRNSLLSMAVCKTSRRSNALTKTELLYLEDSYLREISATVEEILKNSVVLDQTIFYPEGGGQPTDTGRLDCRAGTSRVVAVEKQGNRLLHFLEGPMPGAGDEVYLRLDWDRRYAHMRMHTAQHVVSRVVFDQFGARTAGNQIRAEASHIDFSPAKFQAADLVTIEEAANRLIQANLPVRVEQVSRDELHRVMGPDRSDLSRLPISITQVRLVRIGDFDAYPCAGTHVGRIGELVGLHITNRKSKGQDVVRLTYELMSAK
jgi:misacylated tRNA(Ala) deacylase